ncbi:MAG: EamA family transporter [Chloroflexi bacterium HGW-Chloroflexi-6]|nr:MAG: EamA family transporter [Chloroflexi bacterium HGW-Chloroflexi-6]
MKSASIPFLLQALLAAVFFGASAPLSKLLLGDVPPVLMAAFLYLGSGTGLVLTKLIQSGRSGPQREASLRRADLPWLAGAILSGGVAAPIVLMFSLENTPASTASLLLSFEGVATTLIALFVFKESIGRRAWAAILSITQASVFLSVNFSSGWGLSLGALGILLACILWGVDNNLTRNISGKDPLQIVAWKGLLAGTFSLLLAVFLGNQFPPLLSILAILLIGWVCYGLSTMLFIQSMRGLGAARTSALYGTAPLAGVILSIFIFGELPSAFFTFAALLMVGGALLLVNEKHQHFHLHSAQVHEHSHDHVDSEHGHDSQPGTHAHDHEHPEQQHEHDHLPDIHHRHEHKD